MFITTICKYWKVKTSHNENNTYTKENITEHKNNANVQQKNDQNKQNISTNEIIHENNK